MNKNIGIVITIVVVVLLGIAVISSNRNNRNENTDSVSYDGSKEVAARETVEQFGQQLKMVSVTASPEMARSAMDQYYGPYVSAELLAAWKANPAAAPGKATSSPWPERIAIQAVEPEVDSTIKVTGTVIEITSAEVANGGIAASYPVQIELQDRNGKVLITKFEKGPYTSNTSTSVDGTFSCLPHKDTSGPVTLECAYGIKTEIGRHYALDTSLLSQTAMATLESGSKVQVTGTMVPVEALSSNQWAKYDIIGIIQVTKVQKL